MRWFTRRGARLERQPGSDSTKFAAPLTKLTNSAVRASLRTAAGHPPAAPANRHRRKDLHPIRTRPTPPWHSRCDMARRGAAFAAQAQTVAAAPHHRTAYRGATSGEDSHVDVDSVRQVVRSQ